MTVLHRQDPQFVPIWEGLNKGCVIWFRVIIELQDRKKEHTMNALKTTVALTIAGLLTACSSTSKPTEISEVNNYSGNFAEHRSYALNLMEAAELGGAKDVKLKDGNSVIDLAGSNASFGFVDSLTSGGSLLTASLAGLAGGLLTPDSDAKYNQVIALINVTETPKNVDVDALARKGMLEKVSAFFASAIGASESAGNFSLYEKASSPNNLSGNGRYASVWTDETTSSKCNELSSSYYNEALGYGLAITKESLLDYEEKFFSGNCGVRLFGIKVEKVVTAEKLPWLNENNEYVVVTAKFNGSNVSLNHLSKQVIPVDGLYLYYTSNGANTGKMKDTAYPYIQAPHGKEMYFIKP